MKNANNKKSLRVRAAGLHRGAHRTLGIACQRYSDASKATHLACQAILWISMQIITVILFAHRVANFMHFLT